MKYIFSILLLLCSCLSVLHAQSTEENATQLLTELESQGFHISLEEPHPWNIRDHAVWQVWISEDGNIRDLFRQASPHLQLLSEPIQISLMGRELDSKSLRGLKQLQNLRYLILANTNLTDKTLSELKGIKSLWEIDISDTFATAKSLSYIADCQDLRAIQAYSLDLSGDDFKVIKEFPNLNSLSVSGSRIDNEGWEYISTLKDLTELRCKLTQLTDEGLKNLSNLAKLQTLIAFSTQITDAGVSHMKNMHSLRFVFLDNNHITDDSIKSLYELHNLQQIGIRKTKITENSLKELSTRLPELYIISDFGAIGNEKNKDPVGEPFFRGVREVKDPPESKNTKISNLVFIGVLLPLLLISFIFIRRIIKHKSKK